MTNGTSVYTQEGECNDKQLYTWILVSSTNSGLTSSMLIFFLFQVLVIWPAIPTVATLECAGVVQPAVSVTWTVIIMATAVLILKVAVHLIRHKVDIFSEIKRTKK